MIPDRYQDSQVTIVRIKTDSVIKVVVGIHMDWKMAFEHQGILGQMLRMS